MTEHRSPIPARVYNAAVGGHVCGPEDVDFGQKVIHLIKYDRAGNEVSFESQVTQANKIYVIHDDFTLNSNVNIPANCVLEFDGGSISGAHTLLGTHTIIKAKPVKIFSTDVIFDGNWNIDETFVDWFDTNQNGDRSNAFSKCVDLLNNYGGVIRLLQGKYYIKNVTINKTGITIKGAGPTSTFIVGNNITADDHMLKIYPLIGNSPYTNTENGFFALEDVNIYADGDTSRNYGTGLIIKYCYAYSFTNVHFLGFKINCKIIGSHYLTISNCVFGDKKFDNDGLSGYPGVECFNRGKGIYISDEDLSEGNPQGISIIGGWMSNTSLDFENGGQVHIRDLDMEPMSNSVILGSNSIIENCRLERFTLFASQGEYNKFIWFVIKGHHNVFRDNEFHESGVQNDDDNPIIKVEGSENSIILNRRTIVRGFLHFGQDADKNVVEFHGFNPENYTNNNENYYLDNIKMYATNEKNNIIKYINGSTSVENFKNSIYLKNVKRVGELNGFALSVQNATQSGNTFTITNEESNSRVIYGLGSNFLYEVNTTYLFLLRLTVGNKPVDIGMRACYSKQYSDLHTFAAGYEGYIAVRTKFTESANIIPSVQFRGETGAIFTLEDVQVIKMDNVINPDNDNLISVYHHVYAPIFKKGEIKLDDWGGNVPKYWDGSTWQAMP